MKQLEPVTIPWKCPACNSCQLVVRGVYGCAGPRMCIYGGPFKGYVEVKNALQGTQEAERK